MSSSNRTFSNTAVWEKGDAVDTGPVDHHWQAMTLGVPTDPYYSNNSQWYLNGTWGIHANLVWPDYTGSGILLADFDDGFEYTHPDLAPNYDTTLDYDFVENDADAAPGSTDFHGTAVMGVMIADDNGVGTVGVDFDGTGVGIRLGFGAGDGNIELLEGFQYALAANVDVMNNSWGYDYPFADNFADPTLDFTNTSIADVGVAVQDLADNGRGGLGTNIVFSAGNSGAYGDNVNYHSFQNSIYTIAVGAISSSGHAASFSTPGAALLVSAGGVGDFTTDRSGSTGYANGDYASVDGTSFAAPTVSGVVGLMLQANPNLGWRDVQEILAYSAQHNDPTSGTWQYNDATNWNGGGLHFSTSYGFGAVDAFSAVRLAETWTLQQDSSNMTTFTTATSSPALAIPDLTTVQTTIDVATDVTIEHVQVHVDLTHTFVGDLVITLIAPDGTQSVLVNRAGYNVSGDFQGDGGIDFDLETNADWGESSLGTWTLKIQDAALNDTGTLNSWNLTFTGSNPSTDNTYYYTDDFSTFTGAELAARSVINDTDGGIDSLNLAVLRSNSIVNLLTGTGTIDGKAVTISGIENVYGGDGNDKITGDANDNLIYGGRGNDILDGGAGNDTAAYHDDISNFTFEVVSTTLIYITYDGTQSWTDTDSNFENFVFAGVTYTEAALETYIASLPPPPSETLVGTSGKDVLTGDIGNDTLMGLGANDTLFGGNGSDTLDGGTGSDSMVGGNGNDIYYVDAAGDHVIETTSGGYDTVYSSAASYTLAQNVENLVLVGGATRGTGNALDNIITGNANNNNLSGGLGNDTIYGIDGKNSINGAGGDDTLIGGDGQDNLIGSTGNDVMNGGAGNDSLNAGLGDDTLDGGGGNDVLLGSTGADTFLFHAATAYTGVVTIRDFHTTQNDVIDLRDLLTGYDPLTDNLSDFVQLQAGPRSTMTLWVDADGTGGGSTFVEIASLSGVRNLDLTTLVTDGHLLVS